VPAAIGVGIAVFFRSLDFSLDLVKSLPSVRLQNLFDRFGKDLRDSFDNIKL